MWQELFHGETEFAVSLGMDSLRSLRLSEKYIIA